MTSKLPDYGSIGEIQDSMGFPLVRSVIGRLNSRHFLNQSDVELKSITTWSPAFSRPWGCCCCEFSFTFLLNGYRVTLALVLRNSIEKRSLSIQQSNTRIKIRKRHETSYLRSGGTFLNPVACILSGY